MDRQNARKEPLTDRAIAALKPAQPGKRKLYWDSVVPGLALRVTDTGAKAFVFVKRFPGLPNPTARAIAKYGELSLEDVRAQAREWHKSIAAGIDPKHASDQRARDTLRAICEEYLAREGGKLRSVYQRKSALERLVYPVLGAAPITAIRRSDLVRLLERIEDDQGPHMASNILAIIRRVMNWHAARADDFRSPIVRGMARDKGAARERILTDDELRAVWRATAPSLNIRGTPTAKGEANSSVEPVIGAYIRFLLLTGARRNEAAKMQWAEISGNDWTLPASRNKTGQELVRPLSRAAQAILADMSKAHANGTPNIKGTWVFTRSGDAALGGFTILKAELDRASGTSGWTLHDLRRTARSLMSRAGVPSDHAERCLGHVVGGVRGVYDRHQYRDEMLRAYEALASLIDRIVNPQANVVAIHRS
jgi:integrase